MKEKSISAPPFSWVTPVRPNRIRRTMEDKRQIVLESFSSGTSIAAVARAHGMNANLLHSWRWQYRRGELGTTEEIPQLVPIKVSQQDPTLSRSTESPVKQEAHLEIILGDFRVLVHGAVALEVLRNVLKVLKC